MTLNAVMTVDACYLCSSWASCCDIVRRAYLVCFKYIMWLRLTVIFICRQQKS